MDIHFCDLCGVRVTDVDLRGGHGIRKQYDVICATCLELGHGKEWLARQHGKAGGAPAAVLPAVVRPAVASKDAPVIAHARDRVQTFEDGDDSPVVAPQVIAAEEPEDGIATSEMNGDAVAAEVAARKEAAAAAAESAQTPPKPLPEAGNHFAAAASSFSALAQPSRKGNAAADVDEDAEQGEGLSDESRAAPILADDQTAEEAEGSPFGFKSPSTDDAVAQKDETLPVDRDPLVAEKVAEKPVKKATSASAAFKKSGAGNKSSSTNPKASKSRMPKGGPPRKNNKNKNILVMSLLSLGILTMIMLITVGALKKPAKAQQSIEFDMSQDLKDAIKDARLAATLALKSKVLAEMKAAKGKIQEIQPKIHSFEKEAKAKNDKWDDEAFGQYLENVEWPDTQLMIRNLNDEIVKQGNGG